MSSHIGIQKYTNTKFPRLVQNTCSAPSFGFTCGFTPKWPQIFKDHSLAIRGSTKSTKPNWGFEILSMSASTKTWVVASSIGAVEALKDQLGVCRWNYALRSLQQHAKNNIRSYSQATNLSSASSSASVSKKIKRTKEESMNKVMELNCWGPTTTRF